MYEKKILSELIDVLENRTNPESIRAVYYDLKKKQPEYYDTHDDTAFNEINSGIEHLLTNMLIIAKKDNLGYYNKIRLNCDKISEAYAYLERIPKNIARNKQAEILKRYMETDTSNELLNRYCLAQLDRLDQGKPPENKIGDDCDRLDDILMVLSAITKLEKETYIRNFSEAVFHDSKKFQKLSSTITSILKNYSNEPIEENRKILEWFNLFENPIYLYVKGEAVIHYIDGRLDVNAVNGGVAISPSSIGSIQKIEILSGKVMTVENLTTYHDTDCTDSVVIYLGGFHNTVRTSLLKKIYAENKNADYYHKGDIDIYGFLILENLKEKTGIPFRSYEMDLDTLIKCFRSGHTRPLTKDDIKQANNPQLRQYKEIIDFMLEHNCKVEQECFEAMKLNL
ncbi:MAG: Wadjet anti-phage system protein JetD domain-containing protein [Oscillospiraceae bacterium]